MFPINASLAGYQPVIPQEFNIESRLDVAQLTCMPGAVASIYRGPDTGAAHCTRYFSLYHCSQRSRLVFEDAALRSGIPFLLF